MGEYKVIYEQGSERWRASPTCQVHEGRPTGRVLILAWS